jgi:pimeloyl-ACP methyl ester carboxylesterase
MPGEPKKAHFAALEGVRMRYTDEGSGPPVVLIHGFASSLETWELLAPELAKTHRVVSLDLKGFGWSDRQDGDYSPAAEANHVLALMDKLGIDHAAIVGHSWGSSVTLSLALAAPQRVTRIALYDAWVYEDQLPSTFHMARAAGLGEVLFALFYDQRPDERMALAFYNKDILSEKLVEDVERSLERPGTAAAQLAAVRGQRFSELEKQYRKIDKPVLLLWGKDDVITTLAMGERLSRDLPNARLVVYPRCGHFPMIEAKNESNRELIKFLAEDTGAPPPPPAKETKEGAKAPAAETTEEKK